MKLLNSDGLHPSEFYKMLAFYNSRAQNQNQKYTIIIKIRAILLVMELHQTIS